METVLISAGDVAAMDLSTGLRIFPRGRQRWESARFTKGGTVQLARLQVLDDMKFRQINTYVSDSTILEVEVNEESRFSIEDWKERAETAEWDN